MSRRIVVSCLLSVLCVSVNCRGQSLITQVPEDGVWATYVLEGKTTHIDKEPVKHTGEITIRVVGTEIVAQERFRWIELEQEVRFLAENVRIVDKFLVPESEFGEGKDPVANIQKMWRYHSQFENSNPRSEEAGSASAKTLTVFLPGPFEKVKETEVNGIETELGTLQCEGRIGFQREDVDGTKMDRMYTGYSNVASPFGTVMFKHVVKTKRNDRDGSTMTVVLTLKETGMGAVSAFPDCR